MNNMKKIVNIGKAVRMKTMKAKAGKLIPNLDNKRKYKLH